MPSDSAILSKLIANARRRGYEPIQPMIDLYLLERDKPGTPRVREHFIDMKPRLRPGGRFSPSAMYGCMRQAQFRFLGVRGRVRKDPQFELIMEDGNWRHHKWQAIFRDMERVLGSERFKVVGHEVPIQIPELYIAGTADQVVRIKGKRRLIDYKGINDMGFHWLSHQDEPKEEHVHQIIPYGKALGIPKMSLFYDNKNNQQLLIYPVEYVDIIWHEVIDWLQEVIRLTKRGKVAPPHPECKAGTFLWNKCPYARICFGQATPVQIKRKVFADFDTMDEAWERGNREVDAASEL